MLHDRPLRSSIDRVATPRSNLALENHHRAVGPPGSPWCPSPPSATTSPKAPSPSTRGASSRTSTASPPPARRPRQCAHRTRRLSHRGPIAARRLLALRPRAHRSSRARRRAVLSLNDTDAGPSFNVDYCRLLPSPTAARSSSSARPCRRASRSDSRVRIRSPRSSSASTSRSRSNAFCNSSRRMRRS